MPLREVPLKSHTVHLHWVEALYVCVCVCVDALTARTSLMWRPVKTVSLVS